MYVLIGREEGDGKEWRHGRSETQIKKEDKKEETK